LLFWENLSSDLLHSSAYKVSSLSTGRTKDKGIANPTEMTKPQEKGLLRFEVHQFQVRKRKIRLNNNNKNHGPIF
jgi:hypothetical protein